MTAADAAREQTIANRREIVTSKRAHRLRAACEALVKCGLEAEAAGLQQGGIGVMAMVRDSVQALRVALFDGRDEPRYAATGEALEALGRLWAVS